MKILRFLKKSLLRKIYSVNKGFTLVELLVVIAIIAILAGIVTPNAFNAIEKAKVAKAEADYRAIKSAALNYYTDTGTWPVSGNGGDYETKMFITGENIQSNNQTVWSKPAGWNGPYLEKWPDKNPWGGSYTFKSASSSTPWGNVNARWIELSNVPKTAFQKLQSDLGSDIVKPDSSNSDPVTVSILVSKDQ